MGKLARAQCSLANMDTPGGPTTMPYAHLEELLKRSLEVAEENQKILKRMERNALIGMIAKVILWLIVLGVPIFFLSSYIGPLMAAFTGQAGSPTSVLGIPSVEQLNELKDLYTGK